jgi:chromosome segregation ATPase
LEIEKSLFKTAKKINADIMSQEEDVENQKEKRFQYGVEMGELKRESIRAETESRLVVARETAFQNEIKELLNTRTEIKHDVDDAQSKGLDKLAPQLMTSIREMKLEIFQSRPQIDAIQRDIVEKQKVLVEVQQERAKIELEKERQLSDLAKMTELPIKYRKQSETYKETLSSLAIEISQLAVGLGDLEKKEQVVDLRQQTLENESTALRGQIDQLNAAIQEGERMQNQQIKANELAKEQIETFTEEKIRLEAAYRRVESEVKCI